MNLLKLLRALYWQWVVDTLVNDIHDIEEVLPDLNSMDLYQATKELKQLRLELAHAESKLAQLVNV